MKRGYIMKCPKCNGESVNVTLEQTSGKTKTRRMGCLWAIGRWTLVICTCGLWLLVGKRKETGNVKFNSKTIAICQSCGKRWKV